MTARILLLDIETAPMVAYAWRNYDENIAVEQIIQPGHTICWAAKWYRKAPIYFADCRGVDGPKKMYAELHELMSEADAVVTYNGDKFDLPKVRGGFVQYRLPPAPPIPSIDLYKTVKQLGWQSNRLAFVAPFLGIGDKIKHEGFRLWRDCLAGDERAWARMQRYNMQDTRLLDKLYTVLRPYITTHPWMGDGTRGECPRCGSHRSQSRGIRRTKAFAIQRLQCMSCGGWYDGTRRKVT